MLTRALQATAVLAATILISASTGAAGRETAPATDQLATVPITPVRILDTRLGEPSLAGADVPWSAGETRTVSAAGLGSIPADTLGIVANITALNATQDTFLTLFPTGTTRPLAAALNPTPGRMVFNSATVKLAGGTFQIYNLKGTVDVIVDVTAYLTNDLGSRVAGIDTGTHLVPPYFAAGWPLTSANIGQYAPLAPSTELARIYGFYLDGVSPTARIRTEGILTIYQLYETGTSPAPLEACIRIVGLNGAAPGSETCISTSTAIPMSTTNNVPQNGGGPSSITRTYRFVGPYTPLPETNLWLEARQSATGNVSVGAAFLRVDP